MTGKELTTFTAGTARQILAVVRQAQRQAQKAVQLATASRAAAVGERLEYALPKTTLHPGQTCEAYLMRFNGTEFETDSRLLITIDDVLYSAFCVGSDDHATARVPVPVISGPKLKRWRVASEFGLWVQAVPDADIAAGDTGTVSVWLDDTDTGVNITAKVDWAAGAVGITAGLEQWFVYRRQEREWVWAGGECEEA